MNDKTPVADQPKRQLSLWDSTCMIVGIIIGAGIYQSTPDVAGLVSGPLVLLLVWAAGGVIALIGAVCYAELSTSYPQEGGDYVFLTKGFGRPMGFLFAWVEFWIVRPGNIGAMAFVFAYYFTQLLPRNVFANVLAENILWATAAVLALTLLNILGVRAGKWTQNLLTVIKVVGLLAIVVVAFWPQDADNLAVAEAPAPDRNANYFVAMILVMFTYGGWKDMACVAAEVRHPEKNLFRGLVLGAGCVTVIYLLVNAAFIYGLGFEGLVRSKAAAADLLDRRAWDWSGRAISLLICLSALGAINGIVFTGSRIYYALGTEHPLFRWLGHWNARIGAPLRSLVLQSAVAVGLVAVFGAYESGFQNLVVFTAPFFSFFLFLVGVSLFILRRKEPDTPNPYRVMFYPLTPLLFCASSLALFYGSAQYAWTKLWEERAWSVTMVVIGVVMTIGVVLAVVDELSRSKNSLSDKHNNK